MTTAVESDPAAVAHDVERRIAQRLSQLRADCGWSLETVAERTGISRATLSRLERAELSPTAAMLGRLCSLYGWTMSRLMVDAETRPPDVARAGEQVEWQDPESGYRRRLVSPPAPGLHGEVVDVHLPAGAVVAFDAAPAAGLEHHLWMLDGSLTLHVEGSVFHLTAGDCVRYVLAGPTRFECTGTHEARYMVAIIHP